MIQQIFGTTPDYDGSAIQKFLDTTYYDNCTAILKSLISPINIRYSDTMVNNNKWFLMSEIEVGIKGYMNYTDGFFWDYWKQRTGLSSPQQAASTSPSNTVNSGRSMTYANGTLGTAYAIRSRYSATSTNAVSSIGTSGALRIQYIDSVCGIIPACFVAKD